MDPKAAALLKRSEPEWLIASKKIPDEPIPRAPVRSSYQKDFGMAGEGPETRPYLYKNGMAGSTIDMCEGTVKQTYHIPGYQGHSLNGAAAKERRQQQRRHEQAQNAGTQTPSSSGGGAEGQTVAQPESGIVVSSPDFSTGEDGEGVAECIGPAGVLTMKGTPLAMP